MEVDGVTVAPRTAAAPIFSLTSPLLSLSSKFIVQNTTAVFRDFRQISSEFAIVQFSLGFYTAITAPRVSAPDFGGPHLMLIGGYGALAERLAAGLVIEHGAVVEAIEVLSTLPSPTVYIYPIYIFFIISS